MFTAQLNDEVVVRVVVGSIISTHADTGGIIAAPVTPGQTPEGRILTELDLLLKSGPDDENPYTANLVGDTHHGEISHLKLVNITEHLDAPGEVMFYFDHGMGGTIKDLISAALQAADDAEFSRVVLPLPEPRFNPVTNQHDSLWAVIDRTTRAIRDFAKQGPDNVRMILMVVPDVPSSDERLQYLERVEQNARVWLYGKPA